MKFHQLPILALPYLWVGAIRLSMYAFNDGLSEILIVLFPLSFIFLPFMVKKYLKKFNHITILFIAFPIIIYLAILFKVDWMVFHYLHVLFISHYMMWYFYIFYSKDKLFLKKFTLNLIVLHVVLITLGVYYLSGGKSQFLSAFIFSDSYFYIWTLMHFVATFRISDFKLN